MDRRWRAAHWLLTVVAGVVAIAEWNRTILDAVVLFGIVVGSMIGGSYGLAALFAAAISGHWGLAALSAGFIALWVAHRIARYLNLRRKFDSSAFAAPLGAVEDDLLRDVGGREDGTPLSTLDLYGAGRGGSRESDLTDWDGPAIHIGSLHITTMAAEAICLAQFISGELALPLDRDLLAVAAALVPDSAASERHPTSPFENPRWSLDMAQAARLLAGFAATPAGQDVTRRVELRSMLGDHDLTREQRWVASRHPVRSILALRGIDIAATGMAVIAVIASLPADAIRSLRRAAADRRQRNSTPKGRVTKEVTSGRARRSFALFARTPSGADSRLGTAVWWLVRPACTVTCVVSILLQVGMTPLAATVVVPIAVRPLRLWWVAVLQSVLLLSLGLPVASAALVGRLISTELGLWVLGRGTATARRVAGLDQLITWRHRLLHEAVDEDVRSFTDVIEHLHDLVEVDDQRFDRLIELLVSSWADASGRSQWEAVLVTVRAVVFGRWPKAVAPVLEEEVGRLAVLEATGGTAVRAIPAVVAASTAFAFFPAREVHVFGLHVSGALIAAALVAWVSASTSSRQRMPLTFVFVLPLAALGARGAMVEVLALGLMSGYVAIQARKAVENSLLTYDRGLPQLPRRSTPSSARRDWRAAGIAVKSGRPTVAIRLSEGIARTYPDTTCSSAAWALVARTELDRGRVLRAVDAADKIATTDGASSELLGFIALSRAKVLVGVGSDTEAIRVLEEALPLADGTRTGSSIGIELSRLLAEAGRVDEAEQVLATRVGATSGGRRLVEVVEAQISIATARLSGPSAQKAMDLLTEIESFASVHDALDASQGKYWVDLSGRVALLRGAHLLRARSFDAAQKELRTAVVRLSEPVARAEALILAGAADLAAGRKQEAVTAVAQGVDALEARRGELRSSVRRTAAVHAWSNLYGTALETLHAASEIPHSAEIAAQLIESLKRSALASILRSDASAFRGEMRDIVELALQADTAEPGDLQDEGDGTRSVAQLPLAGLRDQLQRAVSSAFASAFLPSAVDIAAIRAESPGAHLLSYYVDEDGTSWASWLPPSGPAELKRIDRLSGAAELLGCLDADLASQPFEPPMLDGMRGPAVAAWKRAAEALLPDGLQAHMLRVCDSTGLGLVVVPDRELAAVPWASLQIEDGRHVVDVATVQIVPALGLLKARDPNPPAASSILSHVALASSEAEVQWLLSHGTVDAPSLGRFLEELDTRAHDGAYVAAHGIGSGLGQVVPFLDGAALDPLTAMQHPWPSWTLFSSCLVGRFDQSAGGDPLGLPIACLLGGAESVVGGVFRVEDRAAGRIATEVMERCSSGDPPAAAVRAAQLSWLSHHPASPPREWAGFVCVSTSSPS